jgi:hypothetical protein
VSASDAAPALVPSSRHPLDPREGAGPTACSRRVIACLCGAMFLPLIACALIGAFHDRQMAVDDAFISYRYSKNLADGHGLRWNPDSAPSEGFTNLL